MWTIGIVGRKRERYVVLSGNILYSDDGLLNAYMSTIDFFSNNSINMSTKWQKHDRSRVVT